MTTDQAVPRGRRLEPDQRREQIFACARELFLTRDYSAVSTGDIAAATGVARGLINHYFGTKRTLYLEVLRGALTLPPLPRAVLPEGPLERRVHAGVSWFLEFVWQNRQAWMSFLGFGGAAAEEDIGRIVREAEEVCTDRVLEAFDLRGRLTVDEPVRAIIRAYAGMVRAAAAEWLVRGSIDRATVHALLAHCLLAILREVIPDANAPDAECTEARC